MSPEQAADAMEEHVQPNGVKFTRAELLSPRQIKSYWSNLKRGENKAAAAATTTPKTTKRKGRHTRHLPSPSPQFYHPILTENEVWENPEDMGDIIDGDTIYEDDILEEELAEELTYF